MLRCFIILIFLTIPFLATAKNSCTELFRKQSFQTLQEGLVSGLISVSSSLGDLRSNEVMQIQAAVDALGHNLYVIGSAAQARRRNVDTDLPLAVFGGSKKDTKSDIDYIVKDGLGDVASALQLPDIDSSWGVREVDYINLSSSPAIMFRPQSEPLLIEGHGRFLLD